MGDPIRSTGACAREPLPDDLQLPFGAPHRPHDHSEAITRVATAVGTEALSVGASVLARATGSGALGVASSLMGPMGWIGAVVELGEELWRLPVDADVQAFLRVALGDTGAPPSSNRQEAIRLETAAATGAVLLGLEPSEVDHLRERLAAGATFDRQLALVQDMRDAHPRAFADAASRYRTMVGQWQAGVAAGIEGWDADRGWLFDAGREAALAWLEGQPPEAQQRARHRAQRAKREALVDAARQRLDEARIARDVHYRSGVHHAQRVQAEEGAAALASAAERAQGWLAVNDPAVRAGAASHCPAVHTPP